MMSLMSYQGMKRTRDNNHGLQMALAMVVVECQMRVTTKTLFKC